MKEFMREKNYEGKKQRALFSNASEIQKKSERGLSCHITWIVAFFSPDKGLMGILTVGNTRELYPTKTRV